MPSVCCRCSWLWSTYLPRHSLNGPSFRSPWKLNEATHAEWYFAVKTPPGSQRGPGPLGCKIRRNTQGQACWLSANCHFLLLGLRILKCCLWKTLCYNQGQNLSLWQESFCWKRLWGKAAAQAWRLPLPSWLFVGLSVNNLKCWSMGLSISPMAEWDVQTVAFCPSKGKITGCQGPPQQTAAVGSQFFTDIPNSRSSNAITSDRPRKEAVFHYHPLITSKHLMAVQYRRMVSLLKPTPTPQEFLNVSSTHIKVALKRLDFIKIICRVVTCRERIP